MKINCLQCELSKKLDKQVNRLWDLDSLEIRLTDYVHQSVADHIKFTGERYSASLPWKAGHGPSLSNYGNWVARFKSKVKKSKQDSEVLQKYGDVSLE